MTPGTQQAQRIAALFGRRVTTAWSEKEVRQYKMLVKNKLLIDDAQIELIERYYVFQRRRGEKGIHRRDLYTFLNNFSGELDRARAWDGEKRKRLSAKVSQRNGASSDVTPCNDEEFQHISELARAELERFRKEFRHEA